MPKNPTRVSKKAVKKAGAALAVFENSAAALETASAHHLVAADGYNDQSAKVIEQANIAFDVAKDAALDAYKDAVEKAGRAWAVALDKSDDLDAKADAAEQAAYDAQVQADAFRQLLAVA